MKQKKSFFTFGEGMREKKKEEEERREEKREECEWKEKG